VSKNWQHDPIWFAPTAKLGGGWIAHKDSPSAPATPDYAGAAQAQGAANVETARAQGRMNNPNVYTPYGSQTVTWGSGTPQFDETGFNRAQADYQTALNNYQSPSAGYWDESGDNRQWVSGGTGAAPVAPTRDAYTKIQDADQPTITQTLSPQQQSLLDAQNRISGNLAGVAESGLERVSKGFETPFDTSKLPSQINRVGTATYQYGVDAPNLQGSYDQGGKPQYSTGYNQPIQGQIQGAGDIRSGYQGGGQVRYGADPAGQIQTGVQGAGNIRTGYDQAGQQQSGFGDVGSQQRNFDPFGQQQTSFAGGGAVQTGFDSAGRQQGGLQDVGGAQRGLDFSGAPQLPGTNDFSADRDAVTQALLSRSEPQFQRDEELMRTRLINQGIAPGAEASNYDLDTLNRAKNDARQQAVLAGGQEQSRLFGLASQARGQYTSEQSQQGQFANSAQSQAFNQGLAGGNFANAAQQAQFGQNLTGMQASNAAQAQQFGQNQAQGQFANAAQSSQFGQNLSAMQAGNAAQAQDFSQAQGRGQFANTAQSAQAAQNAAAAQFGNTAQGQLYGQNLAGGQFANQAQGQQYGQNQSDLAAYNAAQQQATQQALQAAQFGNTAQQQQFGQNQAQGEFANTAQGQGYQQALGNLSAYNAAQGQANQQNQGAAQFANAAAQNQFGMGQQNAALNNQAAQQMFQQGLANANLTNQNRQQSIQEQAYLRSLPLNELNSLRTGAQVQNPQFQPYQGVTVGQTPVFQAAQAQNQAAQNQYGQEVAQANAFNQGLFTLGGAAIGAPTGTFSDRRLKSNIVRIGTHPIGIGIYEYDIFSTRQRGVMADEIEQIVPEAVSDHGSGYKIVNYAMIGGV